MITSIACPGHPSGPGTCKVSDGTHYHPETPDNLIRVIEEVKAARLRVHIVYGDVETGTEWGDVETGYVGRSTGTCKIPLVLYNRRSAGGPGLLDHCILSISTSRGKRLIYTRGEGKK